MLFPNLITIGNNEEQYRQQVLDKSGLVVDSYEQKYPGVDFSTLDKSLHGSLDFKWQNSVDQDSTSCSEDMTDWEPSSFEITAILIHCYICFMNPEFELDGFVEDDPIPTTSIQKLNSNRSKWLDESGQISFRYKFVRNGSTDHLYIRFHKLTNRQAQMYMISQLKNDMLEVVDIDLNQKVDEFKNLSEFYQKVSEKISRAVSKFKFDLVSNTYQNNNVNSQGIWNNTQFPWGNQNQACYTCNGTGRNNMFMPNPPNILGNSLFNNVNQLQNQGPQQTFNNMNLTQQNINQPQQQNMNLFGQQNTNLFGQQNIFSSAQQNIFGSSQNSLSQPAQSSIFSPTQQNMNQMNQPSIFSNSQQNTNQTLQSSLFSNVQPAQSNMFSSQNNMNQQTQPSIFSAPPQQNPSISTLQSLFSAPQLNINQQTQPSLFSSALQNTNSLSQSNPSNLLTSNTNHTQALGTLSNTLGNINQQPQATLLSQTNQNNTLQPQLTLTRRMSSQKSFSRSRSRSRSRYSSASIRDSMRSYSPRSRSRVRRRSSRQNFVLPPQTNNTMNQFGQQNIIQPTLTNLLNSPQQNMNQTNQPSIFSNSQQNTNQTLQSNLFSNAQPAQSNPFSSQNNMNQQIQPSIFSVPPQQNPGQSALQSLISSSFQNTNPLSQPNPLNPLTPNTNQTQALGTLSNTLGNINQQPQATLLPQINQNNTFQPHLTRTSLLRQHSYSRSRSRSRSRYSSASISDRLRSNSSRSRSRVRTRSSRHNLVLPPQTNTTMNPFGQQNVLSSTQQNTLSSLQNNLSQPAQSSIFPPTQQNINQPTLTNLLSSSQQNLNQMNQPSIFSNSQQNTSQTLQPTLFSNTQPTQSNPFSSQNNMNQQTQPSLFSSALQNTNSQPQSNPSNLLQPNTNQTQTSGTLSSTLQNANQQPQLSLFPQMNQNNTLSTVQTVPRRESRQNSNYRLRSRSRSGSRYSSITRRNNLRCDASRANSRPADDNAQLLFQNLVSPPLPNATNAIRLDDKRDIQPNNTISTLAEPKDNIMMMDNSSIDNANTMNFRCDGYKHDYLASPLNKGDPSNDLTKDDYIDDFEDFEDDNLSEKVRQPYIPENGLDDKLEILQISEPGDEIPEDSDLDL